MVTHQINWQTLVSTGRAKSHGVMWTEEEKELIASGKETVDGLRAADSKKALRAEVARLKAAGEKSDAVKKAATEKATAEKAEKEAAEKAEKEAAKKTK